MLGLYVPLVKLREHQKQQQANFFYPKTYVRAI